MNKYCQPNLHFAGIRTMRRIQQIR